MEDSFETNLPNMPHTFMCLNDDCKVMFFVECGFCPSCGEQPLYKVVDMKYYITRK